MKYIIKAGFQYNIEANSEEEAKKIAEQRFVESIKSYKDGEMPSPIWVKKENCENLSDKAIEYDQFIHAVREAEEW